MILSVIAAMTADGVIGKNNALPWHLPKDLQHFKALTLHKPVIMGRKTFESIGHPLPNRQNIVLTQQKNLFAPGCMIVHSFEEALAQTETAEEVFVIGGAALFAHALPLATYFYLTLIPTPILGNIHFPSWDRHEWEIISQEDFPADDKHLYPFSFILLKRKESH
ncbi:MAG: dihydrofolate reductase [Gammaproteobacteria bacterium]|nr:dihydrofolate reductase [Gammaproteobacteria bacterium]